MVQERHTRLFGEYYIDSDTGSVHKQLKGGCGEFGSEDFPSLSESLWKRAKSLLGQRQLTVILLACCNYPTECCTESLPMQ